MLPARRLKILVIDDDSSVADTLAMVLNVSGFDAIAAYSGEQALELARQEAFNHIITDVMMEPMNGIQVAVAIRAIYPECRVIFMSGNEQTSVLLEEARRDGHGFDVLAKPVHPTLILDMLRRASTGSDSDYSQTSLG